MQHHHHHHLPPLLPHRKPSPLTRLPSFPTPDRRRPTLTVSAAVAAVGDRAAATTMYELLSVAETAGQEEIKAAYRRQARRWHPDACRSSEEKGYYAEQFMRAREAYLVLSDPALREDYDHSLQIGFGGIGGDGLDGVLRGIRFRKGKGSAVGGERSGFGDWEAQLEVLKRRSAYRDDESSSSSWGSRMRRANSAQQPCD